jgi:hypothetical protein
MTRKERKHKAEKERLEAAKDIANIFFKELKADGSREAAWARTVQFLEGVEKKQTGADISTYTLARGMVSKALNSLPGAKTNKADVLKRLGEL